MTEPSVQEILRDLWTREPSDPLARLLPTDAESLESFYPRLKTFVDEHPRDRRGDIEPGAVVRGEIVATGRGSVIEAGAVVHRSCRLVLGEGSVVRSGAVLRDEVVVGDGCTVGVHCEIVRSVLLGPKTTVSHFSLVADSILGRDVLFGGYSHTANTTMRPEGTVRLKLRGRRIDTRRTHLGALLGDGARLGANVTACPGTVVLPGVSIPATAVLYGTIDPGAAAILIERFYQTWDLDR